MNIKNTLLLLTIVLLAGCTQESQQDNINSNYNIVFMSRADSQAGELYYYNATSQEIIRLTNNNRHENNPALSRNGRYIAFHAGNESNPLTWEIYYIDLETMIEHRLTSNNLIDGHPDWSPDSSKIIYASFQDPQENPAGVADLFIIDRTSLNTTRLTSNDYEDSDPEWSPDGTMIVFKSTREKNETLKEEIYVMNPDSSNVRKLTNTTGWNSDHDPSWSPDNKNVVFTHYEGSIPWTSIGDIANFQNNYPFMTPWNSFKVGLKDNNQRLTNSADISALPVYSPDGQKIMYIKYTPIIINNLIMGFEHALVTIKPDGTNPEIIMRDNKHTPTLEYYDW